MRRALDLAIKFLALAAIFAAFFIALAPLAHGQIIISPPPKLQFEDNNGKPFAGGFLFTYAGGTTTPQATFTDSTGLFLNPNPIVLDSAGRASVFLTCGLNYKFVLESSNSVAQYTQDNVIIPCSAVGGGSGGNTQILYNCFGSICGSPNFTFTAGTMTVQLTGSLNVTAGGTLNGVFGGSPTFSGTVTFATPPTFTTGIGSTTAVTQTFGDSSNFVATDAFVQAAVANAVTIPCRQAGSTAAHTGTTTLDTIYTCVIPALGLNSVVTIDFDMRSTNQTAPATLIKTSLGGTTVFASTISSTNSGTNNLSTWRTVIANAGATNSQASKELVLASQCVSAGCAADYFGPNNSNGASLIAQTNVPTTFLLQVQNGAAADSQTFQNFLVQVQQ
jgi:hypothetical protein